MSDINLRPLAEVILDQVTAGRKEAYRRLRENVFSIKRKIDTLITGHLSPVRDPNLNGETADSLRSTINETVNEMYNATDECVQYKRANPSGLQLPTIEDVVGELEQCQREMAEVRWNLEERWLSAITERVVLAMPDNAEHTVDLGQFEIRLNYTPVNRSNRGRRYSYTIFALEPNYPLSERRNSSSGIHPHPHVTATRLCEGEGVSALTRALNEFRLCDFFLLINGILHHYNPQSPYYRLEEWNRVKCRDCNNYVTETDMAPCSYCMTKLCPECATVKTCTICNKTICSKHTGQRRITKCERCEQYICIQHYKSIRKHKCFKEIKKEREEAAEKRLELIEQINKQRKKIAEKKAKKDKNELRQSEATAEQIAQEVTNDIVPGADPSATVVTPELINIENSEIAGQVSNRERPDNRTRQNIIDDFEQGARHETAAERADRLGIDEEEITGPRGWV